MVLNAAYALGLAVLPVYRSKFSRHDFTLPQLFACLVLREHQKKSYRGVEALLRDCPEWCADIDLKRVPNHRTLQKAFDVIVTRRRANRMLDEQAGQLAAAGVLGLHRKPLAMDSTHLESHHVSRHFERRREETARSTRKRAGGTQAADKPGPKPDRGNSRTRPRTVRKLPKLTVAVAAACHAILSAVATTGAGSDSPHFEPVLFHAWRRAPVKTVVADAGFDSEKNHRLARLEMSVRTVIPPGIGRPTRDGRPPSGYYRRIMRRRFQRQADKPVYGQRWQSETVHSMLKRNLGAALRSRTPDRREREMLLRAVVHNLMLQCKLEEDGD
jgi:hypothetical protein